MGLIVEMKISVIVPVYNEEATIEELLLRVHSSHYNKEIIVVDDGSTDETRQILETSSKLKSMALKLIYHDRNLGKGAALKNGFMSATGDVIIIQDADLELNPSDYPKLLEPILGGRADVVYGSRFMGRNVNSLSLHYTGNQFLTTISNAFTHLELSDMETGYKVFKREVLDEIRIKSKRFGFEPEFTAKVAKKQFRISEVPVNYNARSYKEGKKIKWRDGIVALVAIIWFSIFD